MEQRRRGFEVMQRMAGHDDHRRDRNEGPNGLGPDDAAWMATEEPSAVLDVSWIEDDLQKTPADELMATEPVQGQPVPGQVPSDPDIAFTPPPRRPPLRRPVVERIRTRASEDEAPARPIEGEARAIVKVERIV